MQNIESAKPCFFRCFIRRVLEHYGDGTGKHRQHLACSSHRQRDGDSGGDALLTNDNQNGGDYAGECRIWRLRRADVHPAESYQFQRTTEHNSGF